MTYARGIIKSRVPSQKLGKLGELCAPQAKKISGT